MQQTQPMSAPDPSGSPYMLICWTKRAERKALAALPVGTRAHVAPLIMLKPISKGKRDQDPDTGEWIRREPPTYDEHMARQAKWLRQLLLPAGSLFDFPTVFVDVRSLQSQQGKAKIVLADLRTVLGADAASFVPVVAVGDSDEHCKAAADWNLHYRRGVAVRVLRHRGRPWPGVAALEKVARKSGCGASTADLVVDVRQLDSHEVNGLAASLPDLLRRYAAKSWRSVTLAAGGFPRSISDLSMGCSPIVRWDFVLWKRVAFALLSSGSPVPRFGDYGVVKTELGGGGDSPPEVPPNVRYTDEREWAVYRRSRLDQVAELCRTVGADHPGADKLPNDGDAWIADIAAGRVRKEMPGPGRPETWTRVGLSRHVWFAAMQMIGRT
jgi:Beta protein